MYHKYMRKPFLLLGILIILLGSGLLSLGFIKDPKETREVQSEQTSAVSVQEVVDGDTLKLSDGTTVRLIGINAPEKDQPYSNEARSNLEALVTEKSLDMQFDVEKLDKYGRSLAYLYSENIFVNLELLKEGLAVTETISPNVSYADEFIKAQQEARTNCKGMWEGLCSQGSSACVQISSVNKGTSLDLNSEWVEFVNTCSEPQDMTGFLVKDNSASNSYTFKNFKLSPKQKVKLYSGCSTNSQTSLYWECPVRKTAVWNNDGDSAYLFDTAGKLVSEVNY